MKLTERSFLKQQAATIQEASINLDTTVNEASAVDVIVQAFRSDPILRWVWPDLQSYLTVFPSFVRVFGEGAFLQGSAYCVDSCAGAALWLPPNVHYDDEALSNLLRRTVPEDRQPRG